MEIKLVGWTTGSDKLDLAVVANVDKSQLSHFSYLCEKAIKEDIIKNKWLFCGDWHQTGKCGMPVLKLDGKVGIYLVSMRYWGNIMAECWNEIEQTLKYDYMDFYMSCMIDKEPKHCEEEYKF